jgi:hypothetical protein
MSILKSAPLKSIVKPETRGVKSGNNRTVEIQHTISIVLKLNFNFKAPGSLNAKTGFSVELKV